MPNLFPPTFIHITKEILYQRNKYRLRLCNSENVLHTANPFYVTKIINPFLSSLILANNDKVEGF
jgi:hypothetical protein